jgi:hypothetical protein
MSDPELQEAFRALRQSVSPNSSAALTRARILVRAQQQGRRKRLLLLALPFAAALVVSAAWAALTGHLTHGSSAPGRQGVPIQTGEAGKQRVAATSVTTPPPTPSDTTPHAAPTSDVVTLPRSEPPAPKTASVAGSAAASAVSTREQALYEAAHHAHFVEQAPAASLLAWDAYLAQYPHGRFALEARYNRAICLVRLGRRAEARSALTPFANGATSGYRHDEARALLDALDETAADGPAPP